jgi:hypothetical protein
MQNGSNIWIWFKKNQAIGNGKQVWPFPGPRNRVIIAIELGEESVAVKANKLGEESITVKATTIVKWLLHEKHCR